LGGDFTGAFVLNESGQAAGYAYLPGDMVFHATLWKQVGRLTDLGTVGSDQCSASTGINARGQVVGISISLCNVDNAPARAFLWENGSIFDLNALIPPNSSLTLESTFTINDAGEIAGEAVDTSGNGHAFLLIPCDENHPGVDGCDYSLVDATEAGQVRPAPLTQRPQVVNPSNSIRQRLRWQIGPGPRIRRPASAEI
jgi:probable HAF family extracellular repeat protein